MSTYHDPAESSHPYRDPTPMPDNVPKVQELGTTSAPLKSAAFFLGAHCKEYNEDFMLCKAENRDPEHCLKEGRRVTRCAMDLITKMRENCAQEFEKHWNCLELNNQACFRAVRTEWVRQEYYHCRKDERTLNKCMFDNSFRLSTAPILTLLTVHFYQGLVKTIPGSGKTPVHEIRNPIFTDVQK
ncbi:NADH-ubiquinone oxidoreductase 20 subunit, partial [Grifola frondosa]